MFGAFRDLTEVMRGVSSRLEGIRVLLIEDLRLRSEAGTSSDRLEALELSRVLWEAEVEGTLAKAEGKLKAAANADARARTMSKHAEGLFDEFDPDREGSIQEGRDDVPEPDADPGEGQGVLPLRVGLEATDGKTLARNYKFGRFG